MIGEDDLYNIANTLVENIRQTWTGNRKTWRSPAEAARLNVLLEATPIAVERHGVILSATEERRVYKMVREGIWWDWKTGKTI